MRIDWSKIGKRVSFAGALPRERRHGTIEAFNETGSVFVREAIFLHKRKTPRIILHELQADDLTEVTS